MSLPNLDRNCFETDNASAGSQINSKKWTLLVNVYANIRRKLFLIFNWIIGKSLRMFGTPGLYESNFLMVNFMAPKYRSSLSEETLAFELRCAAGVKGALDFEDSMKKECRVS